MASWLDRGVSALEAWLRPAPVVRTRAEQEQVDAQVAELALYHRPTCPYCWRVRWTVARLGLPLKMRAIGDIAHREDLRRGGGRVQVPCLRIAKGSRVAWLYESGDIVRFLVSRFDPRRGTIAEASAPDVRR